MAEVILKNIKKVYPIGDTEKKQRRFLKKAKEENPQTNKVNLQITDEGVVAVQEFSLDIKDKEFIVLVGPSDAASPQRFEWSQVLKRSHPVNYISTAS